jgi:hypothetical protein
MPLSDEYFEASEQQGEGPNPLISGTAPHFYKRRPVHLCTDGRDDDDEGPPNWTDGPDTKRP